MVSKMLPLFWSIILYINESAQYHTTGPSMSGCSGVVHCIDLDQYMAIENDGRKEC